ncbi:MAG: hypothetical protein WC455_12630 [Dehalococcoidia bacterium]
MTNAFIQCQVHMYPAIDSYCRVCREKEKVAREEEQTASVIILVKATN